MGSPYYSSYGYNNGNYADYYNKYYGNYYANSGYGYNQPQATSVLGNNTSMSMANSSIGAAPELWNSNATDSSEGVSETYRKAMEGGSEGGGGGNFFSDFFKGIFNGFKNLLQSLTDPKTLLLMVGMIALCILFPPLGTALMWIGGGLAAMQVMQGVASGNGEQAGEGAFNLGLAVIGGKSASSAGAKAKNAAFAGEKGVSSASSATKPGMFARAKTSVKNWYGRNFGKSPNPGSQAKAMKVQALDKMDDLAAQEKILQAKKVELNNAKGQIDPSDTTALSTADDGIKTVQSQLDDIAAQRKTTQQQLTDAEKLRSQEHLEYRNKEKIRQRDQERVNKNQQKGADTETTESPAQLQAKAQTKAKDLETAKTKQLEADTTATKARTEYESLSKQSVDDFNAAQKVKYEATMKQKVDAAKMEADTDAKNLMALDKKPQGMSEQDYNVKLQQAQIKADESGANYVKLRTEQRTNVGKPQDLTPDEYVQHVKIAKQRMETTASEANKAGTNLTKRDSQFNFTKGQADEAFRLEMTKGNNPKTIAKKAETRATEFRTQADEAQANATKLKTDAGDDVVKLEEANKAQLQADKLKVRADQEEAYAQMAASKAEEMAKFGMWNKFKAAPWQYTLSGAANANTVSGPIFGMLGGGNNGEGGGMLSGLLG